jgi:hypothetical protein
MRSAIRLRELQRLPREWNGASRSEYPARRGSSDNRTQGLISPLSGSRHAGRELIEFHGLLGLLVDEEGRGYRLTHTTKDGRRYRYYVSVERAEEGAKSRDDRARLPANETGRLHIP